MKSLILADPTTPSSWDFAKGIYHKILSKGKELEENFTLGQVYIKRHSNGETWPIIRESVRGKKVYFIHDSSLSPDTWYMSCILVNDALARSDAARIIDVLPFMNYTRQDKRDKPREPNSAEVIAYGISRNAHQVITTDLHAAQIEGFFGSKPVENLFSFPAIADYLKANHREMLENSIVISPDIGAAQRAQYLADRLDKEIAVIYKRRKVAGKVESMRLVGEVAGMNAIIIDDIIDSGGTLVKASEVLRKNGAIGVYACGTHAVFSKEAESRLTANLDKVIITDSIPHPKSRLAQYDKKIEVVSLTGLYSDVISTIAMGGSVSKFFPEKVRKAEAVFPLEDRLEQASLPSTNEHEDKKPESSVV